MKIFDLPLKAVWYLMIESGIKKEEYREITEYWIKRLRNCYDGSTHCKVYIPKCNYCTGIIRTDYTHVRFRYGYTRRTMLFKLDSISIGKGDPEWGAPENKVFILKLGERVE